MSFDDFGAFFATTAGFEEVFALLVLGPVGFPVDFLSVFGPLAIVYGTNGWKGR